MAQKFKPGDKVRVINYGHPYWTTKEMWRHEEEFRVQCENDFWYEGESIIKPREKPDHILREDGDKWTLDMRPEIVGKIGTIKGSYADLIEMKEHGFSGKRDESTEHTYHIDGIPEKAAWYDEEQLELVKE